MKKNQKNKGKHCSVQGCDKPAFCKGLCTKHYQQIRLRGNVIEKDYVFIPGLCKILGCNKSVFAKGFCQTHYLKEHKKNEKNSS